MDLSASWGDRVIAATGVLAPPGIAVALVPFRASFANTDAALALVVVIVAIERTSYVGMPRLEPDVRVRIGDNYVDVETDGMPSTALELLAQSNGRAFGRFVLEPIAGVHVPLEARRVAVILAGQVASAISDHSPAYR